MRWRNYLLLSYIVLFSFAGCGYETPYQRIPDPTVRPIVNEKNMSLADITQALSPSVVGIRTRSPNLDGSVVEGIGSGVIVTEDGYILTNHHVAGKAWQVSVIFFDGTQAAGNAVWSNAALDLAIVKVDGRFPYARMGNSADVRVGDPVIAIGTPLTLQFQHTVTSGIISAKHRMLWVPSDEGETFMEDLLQTDASINSGNSGGPLIDMAGYIIGINTLKIQQAEGIGFAIPIEVAEPIVRHFEEDGEYVTPYLGVFAYDAEMARYYDEEMETVEGLFVINVDPDGPCAEAGIQVGDVLLRADGGVLDTMLDLRVATYRRKVGDSMSLTVQRNGSIHTFDVKLSESPL